MKHCVIFLIFMELEYMSRGEEKLESPNASAMEHEDSLNGSYPTKSDADQYF